MGYYRPIKSVLANKEFIVAFFEFVEVFVQQLPERRFMWFSPPVNLRLVAPRHRGSFVSLPKVAI
jgi:hypothetical protein